MTRREPTSAEHPISMSRYARHRGVSHTSVQRAIADGRLVRSVVHADGQPPQILASVADVEWHRRTSPAHARAADSVLGRPASPTTDSAGHAPRPAVGDDYRRSLVVEKVVKAKLAQVRLDQVQGRLIDADDAGSAQFEIARLVRNQLQEFPDRLADELALETDAHRVRAILVREVDDVLRKLSQRLQALSGTSSATPASPLPPRSSGVPA